MGIPPLLQATDVAKAYAGVRALRSASFDLRAGEVHALVGENGAGKSTLIKILSGAVQPDSGVVAVDNVAVHHKSPQAAMARGIACIHQQPALFPTLTVAENLALGVEARRTFGRVDWRVRARRAKDLLAQVGARIDPLALVDGLSMPEQQLVGIARALGANARILILDEPTASLSSADADHLLSVLRDLRARGVGMIYISHRLEELPAIADRVTVLRDGETIGTRAMPDVTRDDLIAMMVGRSMATIYPKRAVTIGDPVLVLEQFGCTASRVRDVNLTVHAGEIVGLAGLVGAGRTELARAIFGLTPADCGTMLLHGSIVRVRTPRDAVQRGIAYVPEDRRQHGVILDMDIRSNITLPSIDDFANDSAFARVDVARETAVASQYVERMGVKTASLDTPVAALSGGNQQKVALARWLVTSPTLLILDEPTQGVDVGAKAEIHTLVSAMAEQGMAVIMISSELPEIIGMSDRIAVMHGGTIARTFDRADATPALVLAAALGQAAAMPAAGAA